MAEGEGNAAVQVLELEGGITIYGPAHPVGHKDKLFDDLTEHPEAATMSLMEIWGMKGSFVDQLGCKWVNLGTKKQIKGNPHCAGEVDSSPYAFPIAEDEHIIQIDVYMRPLDWGDHNIDLRGIRVSTDKNNHYQAGTLDKTLTTFKAPRGSEFFAFRGGKWKGVISELSIYCRTV